MLRGPVVGARVDQEAVVRRGIFDVKLDRVGVWPYAVHVNTKQQVDEVQLVADQMYRLDREAVVTDTRELLDAGGRVVFA